MATSAVEIPSAEGYIENAVGWKQAADPSWPEFLFKLLQLPPDIVLQYLFSNDQPHCSSRHLLAHPVRDIAVINHSTGIHLYQLGPGFTKIVKPQGKITALACSLQSLVVATFEKEATLVACDLGQKSSEVRRMELPDFRHAVLDMAYSAGLQGGQDLAMVSNTGLWIYNTSMFSFTRCDNHACNRVAWSSKYLAASGQDLRLFATLRYGTNIQVSAPTVIRKVQCTDLQFVANNKILLYIQNGRSGIQALQILPSTDFSSPMLRYLPTIEQEVEFVSLAVDHSTLKLLGNTARGEIVSFMIDPEAKSSVASRVHSVSGNCPCSGCAFFVSGNGQIDVASLWDDGVRLQNFETGFENDTGHGDISSARSEPQLGW